MDATCAEAIELCDSDARFASMRFLWSDWASPEAARRADVLWVADADIAPEAIVTRGLEGKPCIAPES